MSSLVSVLAEPAVAVTVVGFTTKCLPIKLEKHETNATNV